MLADLWHTLHLPETIVTTTTGRCKLIHLGTLATKRMWQERRKAARKSIHEPGSHMIMDATTHFCWPRTTYSRDAGANALVALAKFARYFDVECPSVPISNENHYRLDAKRAMEHIDEDTIDVFISPGSKFTGHFKPVKGISDVRPLFPSFALRAARMPCSCSTSTRLARATAS
jgi:glutamate decarboxylase